MPDVELPPSLQIYATILFILGLVCFAYDFYKDVQERTLKLETWKVSWVDFGLYFVATIICVLYFQFSIELIIRQFGEDNIPKVWQIIAQTLSMQCGIILIIVLGKKYYPNVFTLKFNNSLAKLRYYPLPAFVYFFAALPLVIALSFGWQFVFDLWDSLGFTIETPPQYLVDLIRETSDKAPLIFLIIAAVILAPISEELLFRGCIYLKLKASWGPRAGLIVSSLLFAAMHANTLSFMPLFLLGLLLCRSYERTGKIIVPITFHSLFNLNSIISLLTLPSS